MDEGQGQCEPHTQGASGARGLHKEGDEEEKDEEEGGFMSEVLAMQQNLQELEEDLLQLGCDFQG